MPTVRKVKFQPKQRRILEAVEKGTATWIGVGGGRGAAKSAGIDRVALDQMMGLPGTVCCVMMRNYDQVRKYHIEPMMRAFPELEGYYRKDDAKLRLPVSGGQYSELDFSYAESLADVERRFRSANYYHIFVDQAEQFIEPELREMKQANRWPGAKQGACKMVLAFNMGGAGIQTLRKWFHSKEYNALERPKDFDFIHVFPWDNVEWVRAALEQDGLTELDYYGWPEERRMAYAAERGDYTKNLNSQDESLRARDWFGSWESLEGAFFGRVFDRESTIVTPQQVKALIKPWNPRWIAEDWGKAHYCASYWNARVELAPSEALAVLGWKVEKPLRAVVTYREQIVNEMASGDVARKLVENTPPEERKQVERFYLSPDAFGERDSQNTIAINQGRVMREYGMPYPAEADNERQGGWLLMYNMLLESKRHGAMGGDIWLISSECPELLNAIPVLMRDPKNLDDVLKTDKGNARIEQDCGDACFVAGTLIQTEVGQQPIEAIKAGDKVWTRAGLRTVAHSWLAKRNAPVVHAAFSDGAIVTCTSSHRFFTERGFIPIDSVRYGDKLATWNVCGLRAGGTPDLASIIAGKITSFTETSGVMLTGRYLRGTKFTTGITTAITTLSRTSNASKLISTAVSITVGGSPIRSTWRGFARWLKRGTHLQKAASGIRTTLWGMSRNVLQRCAINAGVGSPVLAGSGSAAMSASQLGVELRGLMTSSEPALFVGRRSSRTATATRSIAAENAVRLVELREAGYADVYDLEVSDQPEFFANGMLVHNSRYSLKSFLSPGVKPKAVELEERLAPIEDYTAKHLAHLQFEKEYKSKMRAFKVR